MTAPDSPGERRLNPCSGLLTLPLPVSEAVPFPDGFLLLLILLLLLLRVGREMVFVAKGAAEQRIWKVLSLGVVPLMLLLFVLVVQRVFEAGV